MKKFNLTLGLIFLAWTHLFATTNFQVNHIEKDQYHINKDYLHMIIPVNFGQALLLSEAQLKSLDVNTIYQIDLVYTSFKSNANFDQEILNQSRVKVLKNKVPQIDRERPEWNFVSQTKATDITTARTFFHGFVIYYRPKAKNESALKNTLAPYRTELTKPYTIDNEKGGRFIHHSGSTITVPANAVTYENGEQVKGAYTINYTEYRNPAEIALSGISMIYKTHNENYNFSSIGMFEITGEQNGQSLRLQKSVAVDFNCTAIVNDAAFYQLDDKRNEWELIRPINEAEFGAKNEQEAQNEVILIKEGAIQEVKDGFNSGWVASSSNGMDFLINRSNTFPEECEVSLNKKAWNSFTSIRGKATIDTLCERVNSDKYLIYTKEGYLETLQTSIFNGRYTWVNSNHEGALVMNFVGNNTMLDDGNRVNGTLLAAGMDKGHTYPNLVSGLNTASFGVYNCDQIYRLKNLKTIHPSYVDAESGKKISNLDVLCVMDLDFNGSFSFDPNYVMLNPKGKNALLLFTTSKEVYLILPEDFTKVDLDQPTPEVKLTNVTAVLKSSKDLEKLLNL